MSYESARRVPPPPIFGVSGENKASGSSGIISLVDIFDEFLFANDRNNNNTNNNNPPSSNYGTEKSGPRFRNEKDHSSDGGNRADRDSFKDDDDVDYDSLDGDGDGFDDTEDGKKRKRARGLPRNVSEVQKVERRCILLYL
jgi:hypothetical protein